MQSQRCKAFIITFSVKRIGLNKPSPKSLRKKTGRTSGGQPGHEGKTLEQVYNPDQSHELKLECCPESGVALGEEQIVGTIRRQVFDLPSPKLEITEYIAYVYELENGQRVSADFPEGVGRGAIRFSLSGMAGIFKRLSDDPAQTHTKHVRRSVRLQRQRSNHYCRP